jgi:hypothetical protein
MTTCNDNLTTIGRTGAVMLGVLALAGTPALADGQTCDATELSKLLPADVAGGDEFGVSVAADGDAVIVGSWRNEVSGMLQHGSAYVYRFDGTDWQPETNLLAWDGAAYDRFGRSVAISGNTVVVGAHFDDDAGSKSGSAHVFVYDGSEWNQVAKLTASDAALGDEFGWSVDVHGDIAVIGAHLDDGAGSAYVFDRNAGGTEAWGQVARLTGSDSAASDQFGFSVAVTDDQIAIGASQRDGATGAVYVFDRPGTGWADATESATLTASDAGLGDEYGSAVSASDNRIMVGAFRNDDAGSASGAAYVYELVGSSWVESKLTASDAAGGDFFGTSVSISGTMAIIGAQLDDVDREGQADGGGRRRERRLRLLRRHRRRAGRGRRVPQRRHGHQHRLVVRLPQPRRLQRQRHARPVRSRARPR